MKSIIKKMVLAASFFLLLGFSNQAMASSETRQATKITYAINLGDVTEMSEDAICAAINEVFATINTDMGTQEQELQCTVTLKASVNVGVVKVEIEVSVSGPCSEVKATGKQVARQLLDDIKDTLLAS